MSKQSNTLDEVLGSIKYDTIDGLVPLDAYYTKETKAALSAMVAEIIGKPPLWNDGMTHEESLQMEGEERLYEDQRQRAIAKGFDMKGGE